MHRSIRSANAQVRRLNLHREVTPAGPHCRSHRTLDSDFPDTHFSEHLDKVFPPLRFPPELAARLLTHASHKTATRGHNLRYSFIGRRVLDAYLLLFLQSSKALQPTHDLELVTTRALNTHVLGEHLAPRWGLGRVLRWSPPIPATVAKSTFEGDSERAAPTADNPNSVNSLWGIKSLALFKSVGLYKVQGQAVQAIIGGIFEQFGGVTAHRIFHTRLLPHILLPQRADGLLDVFHEDALHTRERMGGDSVNSDQKDATSMTQASAEADPDLLDHTPSEGESRLPR